MDASTPEGATEKKKFFNDFLTPRIQSLREAVSQAEAFEDISEEERRNVYNTGVVVSAGAQ